jgi:predicted GH43/DUF377 family glycosyl hydrolase
MFKWKKLGKVFSPNDHPGMPWMHAFAQSPATLIGEDYVRAYFCTRPPPEANGMYLSYIAYIDLDRKELCSIRSICKRPVLPLGAPGTFDEFGTYPVSVVRNGNEVWAYYAGVTRCESVPFNAAIGVAVSRDGGESFARIGPGPVLSYSPDEPFMLGSPRIRIFDGKWYLWYASGKAWLRLNGRLDPLYKIRMAASDDGIHWVKHGCDLLEDRLGDRECQACPDVTYHNGMFHMFFSYRDCHNYKSKEGGYRIGYAFSADMIKWQRRDETAGMKTSEAGWDSQMVNYPHVFMLDGETYMLYQGNDMGLSGFGIAKLISPDDWGRE